LPPTFSVSGDFAQDDAGADRKTPTATSAPARTAYSKNDRSAENVVGGSRRPRERERDEIGDLDVAEVDLHREPRVTGRPILARVIGEAGRFGPRQPFSDDDDERVQTTHHRHPEWAA
jgi:hypothetical protein